MPVYANALIDIVALAIVLIVMISDRLMELPIRESRRFFRLLLALVAGVLLFDIPAWLLDGKLFPGARALCFLLDTLYYGCQILFCHYWLKFSLEWNYGAREKTFRYGWALALPMLLEWIVILTNPFTGWIFSIDDRNVYIRGTYYAVNLIPYYFYIAASSVSAFARFIGARDAETKRRSLSMIVFQFLPVCGAVIESVFYGVSWTWPFCALALLMVYLSAQQQQLAEQRMDVMRQAEETSRLKIELTNNRIAIMLSQIQPHFLYNSLSTIQALCTRDPKLAAQAAGDFTEFLRSNVDSLSADMPVPFGQELEHTKHYLALEQIRFRDRLAIAYDIRATGFALPTLTLQPIVENAVRYGVMQRIEGGSVTIAAEEMPDAFVVSVTDDGVGFDPKKTKRDGRSHIGIENVRDRLKAMCGGTLAIESTPGIGTKAVIRIPKKTSTGGALC